MSFLLKIEKIFFYIFLFSVPFQLRILLFEWGDGGEYSSAFLYFTDIVFFVLFVFWIFSKRKLVVLKNDRYLFLFLLFAFLSFIFSGGIFELGVYKFLKLVEFSVLYFYIKSSLDSFGFKNAVFALVFSGVFQSFLAIFQFFSQSDVGFRILGETILSPDMPGVAKIDLEDSKLMRSYGTFTHPNVLGAYLVFSLLLFFYLIKEKFFKNEFLNVVFLFILSLGLLVSFSRSAILVFLAVFLILFLKFSHLKIKKYFYLLAFLWFLLFVIFFGEFSARANISSENLNLRDVYKNTSYNFIAENPVFGVGIGNFVNELKKTNVFGDLAWAYQPVHNTYFLIASEIGFFGLLSFMLFFVFLLKELKQSRVDFFEKNIFLGILFSVVLLFFIDHYFWSFQQGSLMLFVLLGFASFLAYTKKAG